MLNGLDKTRQGWGQGRQVDSENRPVSSLQFQEKYGQYGAYFIGPSVPGLKTVYLTFDEGYENGYTEKILDTLSEKKVRAAFFVTGDYVERSPELVGRMIEEGHAVGNHSENHHSFPELSLERQREELGLLADRLADRFSYTCTLFRPPCGEFSEQTLACAQAMGYKTLFWSYAYKDWEEGKGIGAEAALEKAVGALHDGAIYLLHAVSADNAAMLGDFIDAAHREGYTFSVIGS